MMQSNAAELPDNRKIVLRQYPPGLPSPDCLGLESEAARQPAAGEIVVQVEYLAIDAWIGTTLSPGWFHEMMPLGATLGALGVGRVLASNAEGFVVGDAVFGSLGAQTVATLAAASCRVVDASRVPITAYLGVLSITAGLTAYFGIRDVAQVRPGDTVLVSAAAGATGCLAGQIARLDGARVIGIAGGVKKCALLTEQLGFAAAIDYKGEDLDARLGELAPQGIDVYFDNVGGEMLDTALNHIRERARVVICGAISQYDDNENVYGPKRYLRLAERYARMEGFTAFHFEDRYPEGMQVLGKWLAKGEIAMPETIEHGIEAFPAALAGLFSGSNTGKLLVKI
jgi:NADPH-dependent curcumin reductase